MDEKRLEARLQAIENAMNSGTAGTMAITAILVALPETAAINDAKAEVALEAIFGAMPVLRPLRAVAASHLATIIENSRRLHDTR